MVVNEDTLTQSLLLFVWVISAYHYGITSHNHKPHSMARYDFLIYMFDPHVRFEDVAIYWQNTCIATLTTSAVNGHQRVLWMKYYIEWHMVY